MFWKNKLHLFLCLSHSVSPLILVISGVNRFRLCYLAEKATDFAAALTVSEYCYV